MGCRLDITLKITWILRETKQVSPFGNFEIIPPLLYYMLDTLTNKYNRVSSSMINYVDRFQNVSKVSPSHEEEG